MHELPACCPRCRRRAMSVEQHLGPYERVSLDPCRGGLKAGGWRCSYARRTGNFPASRSAVQSIASPGVPLCAAKKPLPLQRTGKEGEGDGPLDPDASTTEVGRLKFAT